MSASFTYAQLVEALESWPEDDATEYQDALPRIIALGEERLIVDLNLEIFDRTDTVEVTGNNRMVPKPADIIVARDLWLVTNGVLTPIHQRSRAFCLGFAPNPALLGAVRYYFEHSDTHWQFVPTPNASATAQVLYIARPAGLSTGNQTTWLGTNAGDLLFVCCLMEAEQWLKADDRYNDLKTKYYEELLPTRRAELKNLIRTGQYTPVNAAAKPIQ